MPDLNSETKNKNMSLRDDIVKFLNPKTVTVVGVSRDKKKIGRIIYDQLKKSGRDVFGINPNYLIKDISQIQTPTDLVIYAIPSEYIADELEKSAKLGFKNHLVITSGFSETGSKGKIEEDKLAKLAKKYKILIQGPNCLGNISPTFDFNASFGENCQKGSIGIISQSGAIGTAFLDWSKKHDLGLSHFISLGNKVNLGENEFLEFLGQDKSTEVIGLYLESIKNPQKFLEIGSGISRKKPIIILKAGHSNQAKIAVSSHTGAMAGNYSSQQAAFRQANLIEANSLEDFFLLLEIYARADNNFNFESVLVLTNAGGPAVLAVDSLINEGFKLYKPQKSLKNPIDILGDADISRMRRVLDELVNIPNILLIIILTPQENTDIVGMSEIISSFKSKFKGFLMVNLPGGERQDKSLDFLRKKGIFSCRFLDDAIPIFQKIRTYFNKNNFKKAFIADKITVQKKDLCSIKKILNRPQGFIPEIDALYIAKIYNFPLAPTYFINNGTELEKIAAIIGFPVVLKISSPEIIHRNKEGGVFSDIRTITELKIKYEILKSMRGMVVMQKMIEPQAEIIIGAKKDKQFSHLLMFGSGGIHTEYLKDVNFAVLPLFTRQTMLEMIDKTKISSLIDDKNILWPIFNSLIILLTDFPQIDEIDLNPVILSEGKLSCVDIKIKV